MIKLTANQLNLIRQHTLKCYPKEMCGLLIIDNFIPITNIHEEPLTNFKLDEVELSKFLKTSKILAIVHSHCLPQKSSTRFDLRTPSNLDVQYQKLSGVPWLIVGTEGVTVTPALELPRERNPDYVGRPFIWFISDCYTLIQDYYYYELGITLPDHSDSANYKTLTNYDDIFKKYVKEYKFEEIPYYGNPKDGDLFLLNQGVATCNHLAVYHRGTLIHQAEISIAEPFALFIGRIQKIYRYVG